MIFTGTLLPQDESPLENQKSTLDLLKKINTVSELIPVQTESLAIITSDTLLGSNIRNVIVNTALAVSITIPDGLPMGTEIQITQVYASTSKITLKSKGNDTIEGAVSVSYGINISSLSIMKISKTNWSRVKGAGIIESGSNANGWYEKYSDGTLICRDNVTGTYGAVTTYTFAYAAGFIDTNYTLTFGGRYGSGAAGVPFPIEWNSPARSTMQWSGGCAQYDASVWLAHYFGYVARGRWK
jgi:hypothetical protein